MYNKLRLLTPGPTPLPERVRLVLAQDMIHHRKPLFAQRLLETEEKLKNLFCTTQPVIPLSCSGTGAMTAAVHSLFLPGEKVIVVNGGKFGERWAKIASVRGLDVKEIVLPWGQAITPDSLDACLNANPDAKGVLVQACETSTGVQHPIKDVGMVARSHNMLLVVDGISSVGISPCRMDEWGVDCLLTGSQKGLMVPPGLALISFSARAWEKIHTVPASCFYFNMEGELKHLQKGDGLFTSPINLILGLHESLNMVEENGGFNTVYRKQWALTCMVRASVRALDLQLFAPEHYAWGVTSILLPQGVDGKKLLSVAEKEFGVIFAGGQDAYSGKMVRFGHMGWVDWSDCLAGLHALSYALRAAGGYVASRDYLEIGLDAYHKALDAGPGTIISDPRS